MDNLELVERVEFLVWDGVELLVAAALGERLFEEREPIVGSKQCTITLHSILYQMVLYLRITWIGWKCNHWFIVVVSLVRWKVLITTSRCYISIHVCETGKQTLKKRRKFWLVLAVTFGEVFFYLFRDRSFLNRLFYLYLLLCTLLN